MIEFSRFVNKNPIAAWSIGGLLVLAVLAMCISTIGHDAEPATSASVHRTPTLAGLQSEPGQVPVSLDVASQGNTTVVLAGIHGPVSLPFRRDRSISFAGWASDGSQRASGVYLVIDGSKRLATEYGFDRPDVARALKAPGLRRVGFEVEVPPSVFSAGAHKLGVDILDSIGLGYYSESSRTTIILKDH